MTVRAILMDFNGVIIDDEPIQMQAYKDVLGAEGVEVTEESYMGSLGMDEAAFVRNAYQVCGKECDEAKMPDLIAAKQAKWREMIDKELPLFEGITNFVETMAEEFSLGIVSMAPRDEIDLVLEMAGLTQHFPVIISAEDVSRHKPDPECFRVGFRELDAWRTATGHLPMTHGECLVIEDSPPGIVGARTAGLPVLGVTNTVSADALRTAGASAVAKDLRDWFPESIRRVFV
ncbi:MAG TPA: HAD family phosphatase [Pyrinomonadaceae bacterium]|jgi:HAD superfamily hydrolase (TIGR01509 family)|nr:HAD family phosphatase [Pyrinomonadaceae bacterium]